MHHNRKFPHTSNAINHLNHSHLSIKFILTHTDPRRTFWLNFFNLKCRLCFIQQRAQNCRACGVQRSRLDSLSTMLSFDFMFLSLFRLWTGCQLRHTTDNFRLVANNTRPTTLRTITDNTTPPLTEGRRNWRVGEERER